MKAIALVVVHGGVAYVSQPQHVGVRVVDLDDIRAGGTPIELPRGLGFEELVAQQDLAVDRDFRWAP